MQPNHPGPAHATVVGVFPTPAEARRAVAELRAAGFPTDRIGVLGPDRTDPDGRRPADPTHTLWEETAGVGAAAGGLTGLGLGLGVAAGVFPPLGPVIAGGALVALLASVGAGAAAGAVGGGLLGLGVPENEAREYEGDVRAGRVLVTVHEAGERAAEARDVIRRAGGSVRGPAGVGTPGTGLPATPY